MNSGPRRAGLVAVRDRLCEPAGLKRGPLTGPNPTDRGKRGSKIHLITDRNGLPLSLGISGANMHDSQGLEPLVRGIPPIRSRRGPRRRRPAKLHASSRLKGHDQIVIAKQGGWAPHSKVLAGYLEVVDQWEDNALLGVL